MAAPTKEKPKGKPQGKGAMAFLKRKELGLPIWAWGAILAVLLFFLYKKFSGGSGSAGATPDTSGTDASTGDFPSDSGSGSGGGADTGGGTDSSDELAGIADAINQEPQAIADLLGGQGFFDTQPLPDGSNPSATTAVAGVGALDWGGTAFTSRAQFNAYLKSKGLSASQFATMHPAAYTHYLALPAGVTATKNSKKPAAPKVATKAGTKTLAATAKHVATAVTKLPAPKKAPVVTTAKKPMQGSSTIFGSILGGRVAAVNQPSTLVKSTAKATVKKATPAKSPVKAPAKTAAKPAPKAAAPVKKPAPAKPPAKKKK